MIKKGHWLGRYQRLVDNPIVIREWRRATRDGRPYFFLVFAVTIIFLLLLILYQTFKISPVSYFGLPNNLIGRIFLAAIVLIEIFIAVFWAPFFALNGINGEKRGQSYEILRTTSLTTVDLLWGKLMVALAYPLLLLVSMFPLLSIAFLLGGVTWAELFFSQLGILTAVVYYSLIGLYYSARYEAATTTFILTYLRINFNLFLVPMILFWLFFLISFRIDAYIRDGGAISIIMIGSIVFVGMLISYIVCSSNLVGALLVSEALLIQFDIRVGYEVTLISYHFWVISPWVLLSLMQIWFSWRWFRKTVELIERG